MIVIKGNLLQTVDESLAYFEPTICRLTNRYMHDHPEKDDCRQELRLVVWQFHENKEKYFNSLFVVNRLRWNVINFINRDFGFLWGKKLIQLDGLPEQEQNNALASMITGPINYDASLDIEKLLEKANCSLSHRQKEAITLFLSGAPASMIKRFLGVKGRHLTRYYILLSEAIEILRKENNAENNS
jgi:hypothetical protein